MIEQPRRHELFGSRHAHGGGGTILADTSHPATDESYDQLAAEAVAENEGMPAGGSRAVGPPARSRRRERDSRAGKDA